MGFDAGQCLRGSNSGIKPVEPDSSHAVPESEPPSDADGAGRTLPRRRFDGSLWTSPRSTITARGLLPCGGVKHSVSLREGTEHPSNILGPLW